MARIRFRKGSQRKFFDSVKDKLLVSTLKGLTQFGLQVNESTLRNYYFEARLLPQDLFDDLCLLADIDKNTLKFEVLDQHWGQKLGGSLSKRKK